MAINFLAALAAAGRGLQAAGDAAQAGMWTGPIAPPPAPPIPVPPAQQVRHYTGEPIQWARRPMSPPPTGSTQLGPTAARGPGQPGHLAALAEQLAQQRAAQRAEAVREALNRPVPRPVKRRAAPEAPNRTGGLRY
jgi:hypothetical protein